MKDPYEGHHPSGRPQRESADAAKPAETTEAKKRGGGPPGFDIDVLERGAEIDGKPQQMDRRLFMQLLVYRCPKGVDPKATVEALGKDFEAAKVPVVIYEDANDPRGIAVLTFSEAPDHFVAAVRPILAKDAYADLELRPDMTMLGRSYSGGYERDLEFWILRRPAETALNNEWPWAVWYPLRRGGAFEQLDAREQSKILKEHAIIGRAYGSKNYAHDIRLACHGLDAKDNEFVIGLVGEKLHRLSHVVQTMRKTRQTSEFIVQMGPFFVGKAVVQYAG